MSIIKENLHKYSVDSIQQLKQEFISTADSKIKMIDELVLEYTKGSFEKIVKSLINSNPLKGIIPDSAITESLGKGRVGSYHAISERSKDNERIFDEFTVKDGDLLNNSPVSSCYDEFDVV